MNGIVSVVIPCYNASKTISESLKSVVDQTYKQIEIIVIDDGSIDNSLEIVELFFNKFKVTSKIIVQQNSGPAQARNVGITHSNGDYIAFLDSDDVWNENKLFQQIQIMRMNPKIDLLATRNQNYKIKQKETSKQIDFISFHKLLWSNPIITSSVVVKADLAKNFLFDIKMKHSEDYYVWGQIAKQGTIGILNSPLVNYRTNMGGLSSNLIKMEIGELDTLTKWRQNNYCSEMFYILAAAFSCLRFVRRYLYSVCTKR